MSKRKLEALIRKIEKKTQEERLKELKLAEAQAKKEARLVATTGKAAKLGILANESLIKAFKISGTEAPNSSINASQKRWESLLNDCKNIN